MANRFWDHIANLVAGNRARAAHVNATFDQVEGALDLVANEMNRAIRFTDGNPVEATFQSAATAAQRANMLMGFDGAGLFQLRSGTFTWRSSWAGSTSYAVNDVVRAPSSHFQSIYVCLVAHTSNASNFGTDLGLGRWGLMIDLTQLDLAIAKFQIVTNAQSPFALAAGTDVYVDVTAGAVTLTLPASPTINDQPIRVCHIDGNIQTNPITVARNGNRIMGLTEDMTVNTTNANFELGYSDTNRGWRLIKGI